MLNLYVFSPSKVIKNLSVTTYLEATLLSVPLDGCANRVSKKDDVSIDPGETVVAAHKAQRYKYLLSFTKIHLLFMLPAGSHTAAGWHSILQPNICSQVIILSSFHNMSHFSWLNKQIFFCIIEPKYPSAAYS